MEPDIAPLAKRLAEENNVDWHTLEGTGENGRIVERDVLDYLARVMAGEAALDPTPEPLPEGMDAWVDDQGNPIDRGPGASSSEGDRSGDDGRIDPQDDADEDLLLAGDDLLSGGPEGVREDDATDVAADASSSEQRHGGTSSGAPDLFAPDDAVGRTPAEAAPDLFEPDAEVDAPQDDEATASDFDFGGFPGTEPRREDRIDDLQGASDADEIGAGSLDATSFGADSSASAGEQESGPDDGGSFDLGGASVEEASSGDASFGFDDDGGNHDAVTDVARDEAGAPVAATSDAQGERESWPLARVRTVVRRHVDLGAMLALQRSAGLESGRDRVPASAVLLLAARRAGDRLGVEAPGLALPGGAAGVRVVVPSDSMLGDVAAEIDEVERGGTAANDRADLWIADLSGLGIDEAVLDTELPQLTLGRVLTDDEHGSQKGTLTLASDHDLDHAAAFLARVADLVEDPMRLLG